MKRLFLFLLIITFVLSASAIYAQQKASLGSNNVAVKVDYINFDNSVWDEVGIDNSLYLGLEGYVNITQNLYIGAEVGWANPDEEENGYDAELTYIPIELNFKYVIEPDPNFVLDFGAGVSYNYANFEYDSPWSDWEEDDWLVGGQVFAGFTYKFDQFFIGVNTKYQVTDDFLEENSPGFDLNNFRLGGKIGMMF